MWELILLVFIIALPFLRVPFSTFWLTPEDWLIVLLSSLSVVPVIELVKLMIRKGVIQKDK